MFLFLKMRSWRSPFRLLHPILFLCFCCFVCAQTPTDPNDAKVMQELANNLNAAGTLGWAPGIDPCTWKFVSCSAGRVVSIQLQQMKMKGSLPADFNKLSALQNLGFQGNHLSGPLPSFSGMSELQYAYLNINNFTSIPPDFFTGLTSLQVVALDYNPLAPWSIPDNVKDIATLVNFTASSAGVVGSIPSFFGDALAGMQTLCLAYNNLTGTIPETFSASNIEVLWLNNQLGSMLSGSIEVVSEMTALSQLWLQSNAFTGPIPDLSKCVSLKDLELRDNMLTGSVPATLTSLPALQNVTLINNALQGPYPNFDKQINAVIGENSFCLPNPGPCDKKVDVLLSFAQGVGYPYVLASDWKGNDPCGGWQHVTCDNGNIIILDLVGLDLNGTISPTLASLNSLRALLLSNNNLTGGIPSQLASLPNLEKLDVSNNRLSGKVPAFKKSVIVNVDGNLQIGKNPPSTPSPGSRPQTPDESPTSSTLNPVAPTAGNRPGAVVGAKKDNNRSSSSLGVIVGAVLGGFAGLSAVAGLGFCFYKKGLPRSGRVQSPNTVVVHPQHSASESELLKITVGGQNAVATTSDTQSRTSSGPSDVHVVEAGNMIISIQVLRNITNDFSEENVLGRGGFGVVYKGELHDGTKIAVKRMEAAVMSSKGLNEFQAEIAVLTKVRHRHLVALLGYCIEGTERLLVYEYMPQGPLSHHLFDWEKHNLKPMDWTRRLTIALDVARGVEYLHSLAHQSFIHRDLKPSNILLGDDMRAKVSDFGLVRLAPEGKCSIETRLAGTFGYLAPEYAVTGRVTTKADVFSYGVILMELITGRRALDETQPEESVHLVTWFRRMHISKETFRNAIDKALEVTDETFKNICTVAELAGHCTAREPYQRPDMGHAVNVLSPLVEQWKPSYPDDEDCYGIDLDMTLPQALKKWQAFEDSNVDESIRSMDNTQSSIPTRPSGFADSFTSADGR